MNMNQFYIILFFCITLHQHITPLSSPSFDTLAQWYKEKIIGSRGNNLHSLEINQQDGKIIHNPNKPLKKECPHSTVIHFIKLTGFIALTVLIKLLQE